MRDDKAAFGLYVHVPFCKALCHYCDFAKTANFSRELAAAYLERLTSHWRAWAGSQAVARSAPPRLSSVFFGGGTPSLFGEELEPFMAAVRPYLADGAEISLEANPDDVDAARCAAWRALGVNRLSVGVQTFDAGGLTRLRRVHGALEAERALALALAHFPSVNADLIYGWDGQGRAQWQGDLSRVLASGVQHLSLYNLTFAAGTPIGRAAARGRLVPQSDERLEGYYEDARQRLGAAGFAHEEVSNWARPGHTCRHNWLYWDAGPFVGIGAGAHGYLPEWAGAAARGGVRWEYGRNERQFAAPDAGVVGAGAAAAAGRGILADTSDPAAYARALGVTMHPERTPEDWLLEYVGCGLRTERGVDLARIRRQTDLCLEPRPALAKAFALGLFTRENDVLRLAPAEWFRETAWSLELILSLKPTS